MDSNQKQIIVRLGLLANIFLAGAKIAVGILGQSPALLAEGINSTADVAYYLIVSVFLRVARKPPDSRHPHGHWQLESIGVVVVGAFVMTTAISVFWNSISTMTDVFLGRSDFAGGSEWALNIALATVAIKMFLSWITHRAGKRLGSTMLRSLARDHVNDIYSAAAASLGILLGRMGMPWVDPLAGALVALVILKTGVEILQDGAYALMESSPSPEQQEDILSVVEGIEGVKSLQDMTLRQYGPYQAVNLTIGVDGDLSVRAGDDLATRVEQEMEARWDSLSYIHIHYHPAERFPPAFIKNNHEG